MVLGMYAVVACVKLTNAAPTLTAPQMPMDMCAIQERISVNAVQKQIVLLANYV